jgi:MoxR-like ATPase
MVLDVARQSDDVGEEAPLGESAERVRRALRRAAVGLVERDVLLEVTALAAVAGEHLLVIGPPGTAKSEAVRRVARVFGGRYFEYLLGRFTEPSELFGPVDLRALQAGRLETVTTGMLPEADVAFLDEVFLGSTAILNTLLGILNERRFRRGGTSLSVPLKICVGASNALPDEVALAAFADRFLARVFVAPVPDSALEELLAEGGAANDGAEPGGAADLEVLSRGRERVDLKPIVSPLAHAVRLLRRAGVNLTDRRIVRAQNLIAAAAVMSGRSRASMADLWPLVYVAPTELEQETARDTLRDLLSSAESTLGAAVLDASASDRARAARCTEAARALLETPGETPAEDVALRLEGLLREIDASFRREELPAELTSLRAKLAERLAASPLAGPAANPSA